MRSLYWLHDVRDAVRRSLISDGKSTHLGQRQLDREKEHRLCQTGCYVRRLWEDCSR